MTASDLGRDAWSRLFAQLDDPPVGTVAEALADARDLKVGAAYDVVEDAIDAGILVEEDAGGAFDAVRVTEGDESPDSGEKEDRGAGSELSDPQGEAVETPDEKAVAALDDAIAWFHTQLDRTIRDHTDSGEHPDRPTTARDYFTDVRGWDDETIDDMRLGWAPARRTGLLDHLMGEGHDREAIIGTGLFTDDLTPLWQGRYVLPYFNGDGDPVYAIARCTGSKGGGDAGYDGHPDDGLAGKYAKLRHTDDRVPFDEPIWGHHTLTEGEPVVVAEGIADAITAAEAGYAVLSPVAKEFKKEHYDPLLKAVEAFNVPRVTIVPDSERAGFDAVDGDGSAIRDRVTIPATSPGIGGALRTADHLGERLADSDREVLVAELPLPATGEELHKVDLDDYVNRWGGDLDPVLSSAKPAETYAEYEAATAGSSSTTDDEADGDGDVDESAKRSGEGSSALWDLDLSDLESLEDGDRTKNPFGHTGDSETYFVARRQAGGDVIAKDYKGKGDGVTYNALTGLLVDAGKRRRDDPEGSLSDAEVFHAWRQAKVRNDLAEDDPVPYRAIVGIAVEDELVAGEDLVERDVDTGEVTDEDAEDTYQALPSGTYNNVLDHIREEYNVEPGREPATGRDTDEDDDGEAYDDDPTAAIPLAQLDALDGEEARRYASKRGVEWPTTRDARERLRSDIFQTMHHGDVRLHDAPTALGKSYTVATEPWRRRADTTGEQPVIQLSETREARDQAAQASEEAGVEYATLLGRTEACPVAGGAHDPAEDDDEDDPNTVITMEGTPASAWFETVCEGRGLPFSAAHKYLAENNDQGAELPCEHEGECESIAQWDGLPRDDDGEPAVDVIHATHGFAHVPSIRNGTNVIFDERPAFKTDLDHGRVRKAVAAFLQVSGAPVSTFEELVARAKNPDSSPNEHAEHAYVSDALDYEPDREWYMEAEGAHTLAPALTKAIYYALRPGEGEEEATDANGRYSSTVPHHPPRLDDSAGDGDGWNRTWVSVVLDDEHTVRVVRSSPDMSAARSVAGLDAHPDLTIWQQNVHPDILVEPVLDPTQRALWRRYERGLITVGVGDATRPLTSGEYFDEDGTRALFEALRERYGNRFRTAITAASVEHDTRELLEEVGVEEPNTMHYGEEKSRGDFGDEDVGALNGCIDPGDDYVLDLLAEAGLDATPETTEGEDGEEHRAHGRGFEGPDADRAAALLASVREQHVAQGAGRYARNADDPDDSAVVFVRTDAAPVGFLDVTVPGVEWLATDTQHAIVDALRERPNATAKELADVVDASKEHVRKTLQRLRERGDVSVREGAGDHGAHLYRALSGLGGVDEVQLRPEEETTNDPVYDSYTWSLAIDPAEEAYAITPTGATAVTDCPAGGDDADRPGVTADDDGDSPT